MVAKKPVRKAASGSNTPRRPRKSIADAMSVINVLQNDPKSVFRRVWDAETGRYVAEMFEIAKAKPLIDKAHPPAIMPIRGDPDHVIRCDWDVARNRYECRKLRAEDPDATL